MAIGVETVTRTKWIQPTIATWCFLFVAKHSHVVAIAIACSFFISFQGSIVIASVIFNSQLVAIIVAGSVAGAVANSSSQSVSLSRSCVNSHCCHLAFVWSHVSCHCHRLLFASRLLSLLFSLFYHCRIRCNSYCNSKQPIHFKVSTVASYSILIDALIIYLKCKFFCFRKNYLEV